MSDEKLPVVCIDTEQNSKVLDDAIGAKQHPDGTWEIHVCVVDVLAHFPQLSMGKMKQIHRKMVEIPAYHALLRKISLSPHQPRKAVRVVMHLASNGNARLLSCTREEVMPLAAVSFKQAATAISDKEHPLFSQLSCVYKVAARLYRLRTNRGGISSKSQQSDILPGQLMTQEILLLANTLLAEDARRRGVKLAYRNELPFANGSPQLNVAMQQLNAAVAQSPAQVKAVMDEYSQYPHRILFTSVPLGHFGLALPVYAQFTSPLRFFHQLLNWWLFFGAVAPENIDDMLVKVTQEEKDRKNRAKYGTTDPMLILIKRCEVQRLAAVPFHTVVQKCIEVPNILFSLDKELEKRLVNTQKGTAFSIEDAYAVLITGRSLFSEQSVASVFQWVVKTRDAAGIILWRMRNKERSPSISVANLSAMDESQKLKLLADVLGISWDADLTSIQQTVVENTACCLSTTKSCVVQLEEKKVSDFATLECTFVQIANQKWQCHLLYVSHQGDFSARAEGRSKKESKEEAARLLLEAIAAA